MKFGVQTKKRVDSSLPQSSGSYFSDPLANCIFSCHLRCHAHKQPTQAMKNQPSAHHRHLRHHHVHHRTTHQTNRHTLRMLVMRSKTIMGKLGSRRRRERFGEAKRKSTCRRCGQPGRWAGDTTCPQFSAGKGQGRAQANAAVHGKKRLDGAKTKAVSNTTSICRT